MEATGWPNLQRRPSGCSRLTEPTVTPGGIRLLIATPSHREAVAVNYFVSVLNASAILPRSGVAVETFLECGGPILLLARNGLLTEFIERQNATHLLFVDDDIGFKSEQVLRMLRFDQDFVGGIAPRRREEGIELGAPTETGPEVRDGFISVQWVGAGFMLLKRGTVEKMRSQYQDLRYLGRPNATTGVRRVHYNLFEPMRDTNGGMLEEDLSFCVRWRNMGGTIWADGDGRLSHSMRVLKTCAEPGDRILLTGLN